MIGAGGVGDAAARIAVERDFFELLVVADYDGKKFLLGVCPGSIQMLAPLDDADRTPEA